MFVRLFSTLAAVAVLAGSSPASVYAQSAAPAAPGEAPAAPAPQPAPAQQLAPVPQPAPPQPPVFAGPDGLGVQSANGDFRLQFGLLVHADARFAIDDEGGGVTDTFAGRRLRPYLRGRFARRFEFYFNPDVAGGTLVVQDAYVDTIFGRAFRIRAGKGKTPFGMERLHSASNLLFLERALPTSLVPNRDLGVQVLGDIGGGVVSYLAGVMNGVPDGGSADVDTGDSKDVSGRLVVRPFNHLAATSPARGVGLGISGSRGRQRGAGALPSFRTSIQQPFFSYTGASADGIRTRYSPQAFYYFKAFGGFAEYVHTETPIVEAGVREEIAHDAWQVAASWVLTGETATDAGAGVRPRESFDFGNGNWGAFQVAARYHTLQVDPAAVRLGFATPGSSTTADAWSVGLNWYLTQNFRYTFFFERTVFDDDPNGPRPAEHALALRTQINF